MVVVVLLLLLPKELEKGVEGALLETCEKLIRDTLWAGVAADEAVVALPAAAGACPSCPSRE